MRRGGLTCFFSGSATDVGGAMPDDCNGGAVFCGQCESVSAEESVAGVDYGGCRWEGTGSGGWW